MIKAMRSETIHLGGTARCPEDIASLHKLNLRFAEISIRDLDLFLIQKERYAALKEKLGLYYVCHGPQEGDPNDKIQLEQRYLPRLLRIISLMPELGMKILTLHCWLDSRHVKKDAVLFKIRLLDKVVEQADKAGISICLENLSESAGHLQGVLKAIPGLNLTLDIGHAQLLTRKNNACAIMEMFPERIRHIHLHDNRGGNSPIDDIHLPPGEGIIDFIPVFKKIREISYCRTMTLELKPDGIKQCLGYVQGLLQSSLSSENDLHEK